MSSLRVSCKLLAAPTTPALRWSHRHACSLPLSLLRPPTARAARPRPITTIAADAAATSGADGNETATTTTSIQTLSPLQQDQISLYARALLEWNQRMNLTAVREESEVMARHVEDSLAIIPPLRRHYATRCCGEGGRAGSGGSRLNVVDVGTGPGLPGLILAIACPNWKLTLLESMKKRCLFLEHVIGLAGLSNVQVLRDRAECVGQNLDFREVFDVAVARAVAEMRILAEYCLPLVRVGGLFIAAKGYNPQEEVENAQNAVRLLGASIIDLCSETIFWITPRTLEVVIFNAFELLLFTWSIFLGGISRTTWTSNSCNLLQGTCNPKEVSPSARSSLKDAVMRETMFSFDM